MKPTIISRYLLALFFTAAGANHFLSPEVYLAMIPDWLPAPEILNWISGAAEIAGGIAILFQRTRKAAAIGLVLLLVAVFPANLHVAIHGWPGTDLPQWILLARLPLQLVFIAWVTYSSEIFRKKVESIPHK